MIVALVLLIPSSATAAQRAASSSSSPAAALPVGWSAGPVRIGTGFHRPGGSERVREVQRRLRAVGISPGPVDGLFGPRTDAAVESFQTEHGLVVDGVVGVQTLTALRELTGAAPVVKHFQEPDRAERAAARGSTPRPQHAARRADGSQQPAGGRGTAFASTGLVAIALLLLAAPAALLVRRRTRAPKQRRPSADRELADGPAPQAPTAASPPAPTPAAPTPAVPTRAAPTRERPPAIGYVRSARDRAELARHAGAVKRACTSRGWELAELVRDDQPGGSRTFDRPGLAAAMERLSAPGPSRLVVSKLAHLSHSAAGLIAMFEWFDTHEVQVIAVDAGLDTTTPAGKQAARSLLAALARRQAQARKGRRSGAHEKVEVGVGRGHDGPGDEGGSE
jgi:peptidoglycan hydrolase-like protein with peptidoglycan-binding domain